jgi:hypothetical protein
MSSKVEKPTLQGQRIKTRKRDEKEKYDPNTFRDLILQGVQEILQSSSPNSKETQSSQAGSADQLVSAVAAVQITDAPITDLSPADAPPSSVEPSSVDADSNHHDSSFAAATTSAESSDDDSVDVSHSDSAALPTQTVEVNASRNIHFERNQFEALSKFLDVSGSKLNYRRYGDVLLDIIIAGGILGKVHF